MTRDVSSDRKDFGESLFGGRDSRGSCRRAPRIFRARLFSLPLKSIEEDGARAEEGETRYIFVGRIDLSVGISACNKRRDRGYSRKKGGGVPFSGEFLGW